MRERVSRLIKLVAYFYSAKFVSLRVCLCACANPLCVCVHASVCVHKVGVCVNVLLYSNICVCVCESLWILQ